MNLPTGRMRKWISAVLPMLVFTSIAAEASEIRGPFQSCQRTNQMSTKHFYLHNASGKPFEIRVRCLTMKTRHDDWAAFPRLMVRTFDVNERPIFRADITSPESAVREKLPHEVTIKVPRSEPGVVQVVVSGGRTPESTFDLTTNPPLPFGIMGSVKVIVPPEGGIEEGFVYIPPGTTQLHLEPVDADIVLVDEKGNEVLRDRSATIPINRTNVVWRIAIKPRRWPGAKILTDGFPLIVCPDEKTARAIRGSIEQLDDGILVAHKFQVRLDRLLRKTFHSPDNFSLKPIRSFEPMTDVLLSDPERYRYLIVGYCPPLPFLDFWFQRQVLDGKSPYFGGVHAPAGYGEILTPYTIRGSPLNSSEPFVPLPPATDEQAHDVWTSFSPWGFVGSMAFLYDLDRKVNPYRHDRHLLNRIIIAACRDLMLLNEGELIQGRPSDWMGTFAFIFRYSIVDPYGYVGQTVKELYPEIHREWTEGMERFADRIAYMSVFAPANQAAHIPYGLWQVHKGSGDDFYRELTRYTAQRLCDCLQKPAGYLVEGYGPCTSYNGITLDLFAMLWIDTKMPLFLESMQKTFYCLNHTVAAEPSGQLIGVTDLNHRVQMPWTRTQHGGGKRMMAPYLKEAGAWFRKKPTEEEKAGLAEAIRERAREIPYPIEYCAKFTGEKTRLANGSSKRHYQYFNPNIKPGGIFPYEEEKPFLRNLGEEFICVKQPRYYTMIYVGKPGIGRRNELLPPMETGTRTGGGISLLWTPDYCVALAGQGWNSYCHHGLIVDMGGDRVRTADYYAVEFDLDSAKKTLDVRGKIEDLPLNYRYSYRFAEDRIGIETQVKATDHLKAESVYLQFPFFAAKERGFHAEMPKELAANLRLTDDTGAGIELRFAKPVPASFGHTTENKVYPIEYVIRQLKVTLPEQWKTGQELSIKYEIVPIRKRG